ncbi:MAG: hypothetical protein H6513_12365 [Acidimicrobiaceae bacterium]|nr:hypothetical protein [Ilumatobacter sp.]MCB9381471.1 hypothetical protein [Acidimicrobiaceae bacterium]MCO5329261.1 hypothetical protein [Ilumatobacteraceae bacterium]
MADMSMVASMAEPFVDLVDSDLLPPPPASVGPRDLWPTVRNWLLVAMAALLAFAWFARGRVDTAEESRGRHEDWVEYNDHWSTWFEQYGLPAYERVLDGGQVSGDQLTLTSRTYPEGDGLGVGGPVRAVMGEVEGWRRLSSPRHGEVLDLVEEWDLGVVGVLNGTGTRVVDPEGLAALDGPGFLDRLRAAEQAALPAMQDDLDRAVLVHRLWLGAMYASMALVALGPFGLIAAGRRLRPEE